MVKPAHHIAVFQETSIRLVWHNEEWWFAIVDVVGVLTDLEQSESYEKDLRRRDPELAKGSGQIATPLRVPTAGGAQRLNCANTEGLFRILQYIPLPKAEQAQSSSEVDGAQGHASLTDQVQLHPI